ncbi:CII family transcriptional regulator [Paraburkholderia susongensis]|uniref:Bacteriophage CII protein n=1 Tax=Paraburkholderia susongensis TaxID=1515439 RepID=A0A1X7I5H1_9BURK|nr:CII family transcriptional regulator [Paraburkholderia susongensis]SMG09702.1 Bacteriophage CII protein [Paraburkholderia susongensis]
MSTLEVSSDAVESTRILGARIESEILRAVARVTQAHAAECMGMSASTVSRMLEELPKWARLIAALELQLATADSMVVDHTELAALESMAMKYLETRLQQRIVKGGGQ